MAVGSSKVAEVYLNVVAATPVNCDWHAATENEIVVTYGIGSFEAVLGEDYEVTLAVDFATFTVTPKAALIAKINAAIAASPTDEYNVITIRRRSSTITEVTDDVVRFASWTKSEWERVWKKLQEVEERLLRSISFPAKEVGDPDSWDDAVLPAAERRASKAIILTAQGKVTVSEDDYEDQLANVTAQAEAAIAAKDAAVSAKDTAVDAAASASADKDTTEGYKNEAAASAALAAAYVMTMSVINADQNITVNRSYVTNKAGLLTLTLPAVSAVGDYVQVVGMAAGGWKVAQQAGQNIRFAGVTSTVGAGGSIASTDVDDVITMRCVVANTTWKVISSVGNLVVT